MCLRYQYQHIRNRCDSIWFRILLRLCLRGIYGEQFTYEEIDMDKLGKDEPCLILMNHSSFIDLKIASTILFQDHSTSFVHPMDLLGKNG